MQRVCVSKNTTVRASKYEPERAMSEGKVRQGLGGRGQL